MVHRTASLLTGGDFVILAFMQLPALLFVTNLQNSDPEEDLFLSGYLSSVFDLQVASPSEALALLPKARRCLIRNAWPSRFFVKEFMEMRRISALERVRFYNPFHRNGYVEDKTYLLDLYKQRYPVIPTITSEKEIDQLPKSKKYVVKPNDGGSSFGVEFITKEEVLEREWLNYLIQPEIDLLYEISFYFIDDTFEYAMVSAGKGRRWELQEYHPTQAELDWAQAFVRWNKLPYGLQRIDAARTRTQELLLMEIEDTMPMLTLSDLPNSSRERILENFVKSLARNLL